MSSTLRVKKHRLKIKNEGNEELQNKIKANAKKYREVFMEKIKLDEEKLKIQRQKIAEGVRKFRERKRVEEERGQINVEASAFPSASAKSKAVKRVKGALPKNDDKKKEVVEVIAKQMKMNLTSIPVKQSRKTKKELKTLVVKFLESDLVSRLQPGMRDFVNMKDNDGKKIKKQAYTMTLSLKEAHKVFLETFEDQHISFSYFTTLRPKYILLMEEATHNSCLCTYCANMNLICDALQPHFIKKISCHDLLIELCCSTDDFQCAMNNCASCQNYMEKIKSLLNLDCYETPVHYEKWMRNKENNNYVEKINLIDSVVQTVIEDFDNEFKCYKQHKYVAKIQKNFLDEKRKTLKEEEAILICDYSEKFGSISQNAVQSSYFGRKMMSIFTCKAYVGQNKDYSFSLVSDNVKQTKYEVFACLKSIIDRMKVENSSLKHIYLFSDGSASQFKSRFHFLNLIFSVDDFGLTIEIHFFETGHGKSPCDGIGGAIKRFVHYKVLSNRFTVFNASDFVKCAATFTDKTICYEIKNSDQQPFLNVLKQRWEPEHKIKTIKGTHGYHCFKKSDVYGYITAATTSLEDDVKEFKMI